jgi:hypothetical protein
MSGRRFYHNHKTGGTRLVPAWIRTTIHGSRPLPPGKRTQVTTESRPLRTRKRNLTGCYTSESMTDQAMVDLFARLAQPRLVELLRLKVRHVYEITPGTADSKLVVDGSEVRFKFMRTSQPYQDIQRFTAEEKVMGFVIGPGVLPIAKAISTDLRGRKLLVTRRIQDRGDEKGVFGHLDHFGGRVIMSFDAERNETNVVWEALYGVA